MNLSSLLANTYSGGSPFFSSINSMGVLAPFFWMFMLIFVVIMVLASWRIFQKASKPGWASIIPIYNLIVMLQIIKKPLWWIVLFFIPFVSAITGIIISYNLAKAFGKGVGFTFGLIFLPFIFYPILGFGEAKYQLRTESSSIPNSVV